jgi:hypothetical protein
LDHGSGIAFHCADYLWRDFLDLSVSVPSGYRTWCVQRGITPDHPDDWSLEDHAAFLHWKREHYRAKWDMYFSLGLPQHWRRMIRDDVEAALAPPPTRPWRACSCHPRPGLHASGVMIDPELCVTEHEIDAWIKRDSFVREPLTRAVQACLTYLERDFRTHNGTM